MIWSKCKQNPVNSPTLSSSLVPIGYIWISLAWYTSPWGPNFFQILPRKLLLLPILHSMLQQLLTCISPPFTGKVINQMPVVEMPSLLEITFPSCLLHLIHQGSSSPLLVHSFSTDVHSEVCTLVAIHKMMHWSVENIRTFMCIFSYLIFLIFPFWWYL